MEWTKLYFLEIQKLAKFILFHVTKASQNQKLCYVKSTKLIRWRANKNDQ